MGARHSSNNNSSNRRRRSRNYSLRLGMDEYKGLTPDDLYWMARMPYSHYKRLQNMVGPDFGSKKKKVLKKKSRKVSRKRKSKKK